MCGCVSEVVVGYFILFFSESVYMFCLRDKKGGGREEKLLSWGSCLNV